MKTYTDVINETVEYYSKDPINRRSFDSAGHCLYNGPDGRQCAFARCAEPIHLDYEQNEAAWIINKLGKEILKPEYRHLTNERFWNSLQSLHDSSEYWGEEGLTMEGKDFVEYITNKYKHENN